MIEVREAEAGDLEAMLAIYNDAVINTTATYDYEPRSRNAQRQWFEAKHARWWGSMRVSWRDSPATVRSASGPLHGRELDLCRGRTARQRRGHGDLRSARRDRARKRLSCDGGRHRCDQSGELEAARQIRLRAGCAFPAGRLEIRALARLGVPGADFLIQSVFSPAGGPKPHPRTRTR